MKRFLLLFLTIKVIAEPIVFNSIISPSNCTHTIYHPKDRDIPHPYFSDKKMDRKSMKTPFKAVGSGTFLYHKEKNVLEYAISYTNLSSPPLMIHLQLGYPHQDGPIIATLVGKPYEKPRSFPHVSKQAAGQDRMATNNTFGFIKGMVKLSKIGDPTGKKNSSKEEKMLLQGGCYITIHTHLNELGELRGQLTPLSTKNLRQK